MFFHLESKFDLGHVRPKLNVEGLLMKYVHYPTQNSIQSVPCQRHARAMGFEMFDLSAMSSTDVLLPQTEGVSGLGVVDPAPELSNARVQRSTRM